MREAFKKALAKDMMDHTTRGVFADFLEENGFDDEAVIEREKIVGLKGLQQMADEMNQHERESWEEYKRKYPDEYKGEYEDDEDEMSRAVTVEQLLKAGSSEGWCFGRDDDPQYLYANDDRFWENYFKATGQPVPEEKPSGSFHCAC